MNKKAQLAALKAEMLWGEDVDLFLSYYTVKFLHNISSSMRMHQLEDEDLLGTLRRFLFPEEVVGIFNQILTVSDRQKVAKRLDWDDNSSQSMKMREMLEVLNRNLLCRKKMWPLLESVLAKREAEFLAHLENPQHRVLTAELRFGELKKLLDLNDQEQELLIFLFITQSCFADFGEFALGNYRNRAKIQTLAQVLGKMDCEVSELFGTQSKIVRYELVDEDFELDSTFMGYLSGVGQQVLADKFWSRYAGEVLPWEFHGQLATQNGAILQKMIQAKRPDTGLSILFYGVAGSGKTSFAASLAKQLGKDLYFIAQNDNNTKRMSYSCAFRYAALAAAQKQLDPDKCILVVDECDKMVENVSSGGGFLDFLGINAPGSRDGETKGQLNTVMDENRHTVLWICNSKQNAIDPSSRRRFDYSVFFDELSSSSRQYIWQNALKFYGCADRLSEEFIRKLSVRYPVNPGGVAVAVRNAVAVCLHDQTANFETELLTFLKAHCALLGIAEAPAELLEPTRDYSLEGLNIKSGIKLPRLIEVCRKFLSSMESLTVNRDQPRLNILLFGVPGAGKTEFVKYLAQQLGKKLCVKLAADLLNCYVGGTEQRIAAAFAEAESNGDILFIDEGDSLLGNREGASKSWEVSQVNTLLAEMEKFRGIFIVSTNLIQKLDQAALRRFSFRLHFDFLTNAGKECFFRTYFGQSGQVELTKAEIEQLHAIEQMTPSDFRNTRQQFFYLEDEKLTNQEIIEALAVEAAAKNLGKNYTGLGKLASRIGF